jgi:hypothetical protein
MRSLALSSLVVLMGATGLSPAAEDGLVVGSELPDLVLPLLEGGEPTSLREFRGGPVLLHVFASW